MQCRMQPMVAIAKDREKEAFADRLNKAYDRMSGAPGRGRRASWLSRELSRKHGSHVVSVETCRKWLSGLAMPDQAHMGMLAKHADVDVNWLHTGEPSRSKQPPERRGDALAVVHGVQLTREGALFGAEWEKLGAEGREAISTILELLVAKQRRIERGKKTRDQDRDGPRADA